MDDEKSIAGKLADAISRAADSVKSVASTLVDKASNAAQHAMEANAEKISRIPPAKADLAQVGTTNEQVYIPQTNDAAAMPMPLIPPASVGKKRTPNKPAAAIPKRRKAAKPATKSANKAATKPAAKKTKKAAKKSSVRASKKAKRKSKKQEF
jgi:hypothetical protein